MFVNVAPVAGSPDGAVCLAHKEEMKRPGNLPGRRIPPEGWQSLVECARLQIGRRRSPRRLRVQIPPPPRLSPR